jgi:Trypsin-like peptidase domain
VKVIPFIQSVIASIVRVRIVDGSGYVERLHGTGFFIGTKGHLLTARHVIEKGQLDCKQNGGFLAFFPKMDDGSSSHCRPISAVNFAPEPFDIAICATKSPSRTFYRIVPRSIEVWQDVASAGYPMSVVKQSEGTYEVHTRFHRGYVQRLLRPGDLLIGPNPPAFEVSFPVTQGMSGAPLFIYHTQGDFLIGVCVGSIQSRIVAYEETQVSGPNETYKEQVARIEEIGVAHSVLALTDWKPEMLKGQSLVEYSNESWAAA